MHANESKNIIGKESVIAAIDEENKTSNKLFNQINTTVPLLMNENDSKSHKNVDFKNNKIIYLCSPNPFYKSNGKSIEVPSYYRNNLKNIYYSNSMQNEKAISNNDKHFSSTLDDVSSKFNDVITDLSNRQKIWKNSSDKLKNKPSPVKALLNQQINTLLTKENDEINNNNAKKHVNDPAAADKSIEANKAVTVCHECGVELTRYFYIFII